MTNRPGYEAAYLAAANDPDWTDPAAQPREEPATDLHHVIDRNGMVWRVVRDGGMAVRGTYVGIESIGMETLRQTKGPLIDLEARLAEAAAHATESLRRDRPMSDRAQPREEPATDVRLWSAHGLAAMDELRRLYFEGSEGRGPGHIAVVDWEPCEDAIRTALAEAAQGAWTTIEGDGTGTALPPVEDEGLARVYEDGLKAGIIAGQAGKDFGAALDELNALVMDSDTGPTADAIRALARLIEQDEEANR